MTAEPTFAFDNSYARLPDRFSVRMAPTPIPAPQLVRLNLQLAQHLGIDPEALSSVEGIEILSGNSVPAEAAPLAMAYAGHQFGVWVPQLGDGRAILLGEVIDRDGVRRDIQLKGAGRTPFSRMGDGSASCASRTTAWVRFIQPESGASGQIGAAVRRVFGALRSIG